VLLVIIIVVSIILLAVSFLGGAIGRSFVDIDLPNWIIVSKPQFELSPEVVFHIFRLPVTNTILSAWLSMVAVIVISYLGTRKMKLVPSGIQNIAEFGFETFLNICISIAGEKNGRRFFPVVSTIFLFVLANAWLGLVPGIGSILITKEVVEHGEIVKETVHLFRPANTDINMALALAIFSLLFVEYMGLRTLGKRYIGKFLNFDKLAQGSRTILKGNIMAGIQTIAVGAIDLLVGILEALAHLTRTISFTFRLFGNMTAAKILLLVIFFVMPWFLAIPFYGLEILIGMIQAFIFAALTLIFASVAVTGHGKEEATQ
jgi:F-type H+-transporting ATPase subunit a